jgi:hypothetical protein
MRIVSLNAWGGACWPALQDWLPDSGAAVLCLQEVIRPVDLAAPGWLRYKDPFRDLAQRSDLFADVAALLPGWRGWFSPAARGPLAGEDGRLWLTDHGLGLWSAPEVAVTAMHAGFVHGDFRADGWGPEPVPRALQMARILAPGMGAAVVGHFHGLRDPAGKGDSPARQAQTKAVFDQLAAFRRPGDLVVLAGDFNLLPDNSFFTAARAAGLTDLVTAGGHGDTRTVLYDKPVRHADYLLISDPGRVRAFAVPGAPVLSDHRPLLLDLSPA